MVSGCIGLRGPVRRSLAATGYSAFTGICGAAKIVSFQIPKPPAQFNGLCRGCFFENPPTAMRHFCKITEKVNFWMLTYVQSHIIYKTLFREVGAGFQNRVLSTYLPNVLIMSRKMWI